MDDELGERRVECLVRERQRFGGGFGDGDSWQLRAGRLDERVEGSTAATALGSEPRDELLGQDARPAADVERSLTGRNPGEVRERDREAAASIGP